MLSQNTLVWVGGTAASTVVVAGAVAGAMLWTHPEFLWPNPAARGPGQRPEPKAPSVPPAVRPLRPLPRRAAGRHPPGALASERRSAAQAGLRRGERRSRHRRSGHRRPRRAKRQSRAARRRQDGRRGDGRRRRPVRHHPAAPGAGRSRPDAGLGRGRRGAGNVERGHRVGSADGSEGRRGRCRAR